MVDEKDSPAERARRTKRRVSSVVYAVYVAVTSAFILLSIKALMDGVFHEPETGSPAAVVASTGKACADGVRTLATALDRGMAAAATAKDEPGAKASFERAISPEWDREAAVGTDCKTDLRGADAFAALLRLRRAEEGFLGRQVVEIAPLRRDVEAYAP
jgi:hypothetical protein